MYQNSHLLWHKRFRSSPVKHPCYGFKLLQKDQRWGKLSSYWWLLSTPLQVMKLQLHFNNMLLLFLHELRDVKTAYFRFSGNESTLPALYYHWWQHSALVQRWLSSKAMPSSDLTRWTPAACTSQEATTAGRTVWPTVRESGYLPFLSTLETLWKPPAVSAFGVKFVVCLQFVEFSTAFPRSVWWVEKRPNGGIFPSKHERTYHLGLHCTYIGWTIWIHSNRTWCVKFLCTIKHQKPWFTWCKQLIEQTFQLFECEFHPIVCLWLVVMN